VRLSIALPAYNEESTLEEIVEEALLAGAATTEEFEVLIIDDGSVDATGCLADSLAASQPHVRVVHHKYNQGFSGAMRSCVQEASGEYIFLGPADGQAEFKEIRRFWAIRAEYDLIFSHRVMRKDSARRKIASAIWYTYLRIVLGRRIPEFASTFLFRRSAIPALPVEIRPDAANFLPLLYITAIATGRRVGTLGTVQHERRGGVAKGAGMANAARTVIEGVELGWQLRLKQRHGEGDTYDRPAGDYVPSARL
jgi:glycosyltransferase involved in cell wall biosynthesis